jgi:diguanylate cyclase (GGDEF)-like protein
MRNLARELARSRRYGHRLAVLRCAVDEFAQIHDRLGSEVGNDILRAIVGRAKSCLRRGNDWLARVETNEFMIVLPQADLNRAHRVAQTMRQALVRDAAATGAAAISFTLSIGVTAIDRKYDGKTFLKSEDLLRAAERGLHASKRRGGNRVTAAAVSNSITIDVGSLLEGNNAVH